MCLGAAVVTAALGHLVDTGVILGVVVINALIGFIQARRKNRSTPSATCCRCVPS